MCIALGRPTASIEFGKNTGQCGFSLRFYTAIEIHSKLLHKYKVYSFAIIQYRSHTNVFVYIYIYTLRIQLVGDLYGPGKVIKTQTHTQTFTHTLYRKVSARNPRIIPACPTNTYCTYLCIITTTAKHRNVELGARIWRASILIETTADGRRTSNIDVRFARIINQRLRVLRHT